MAVKEYSSFVWDIGERQILLFPVTRNGHPQLRARRVSSCCVCSVCRCYRTSCTAPTWATRPSRWTSTDSGLSALCRSSSIKVTLSESRAWTSVQCVIDTPPPLRNHRYYLPDTLSRITLVRIYFIFGYDNLERFICSAPIHVCDLLCLTDCVVIVDK